MAFAGCQVQAIGRLANALQYHEGFDIAILKLTWALSFYSFGGKKDLVTNYVGYVTAVGIGVMFLIGLSS